MRNVLTVVSAFSFLVLIGCGEKPAPADAAPQGEEAAVAPTQASQENVALELVKKLSLCVNTRMIGVSADCVRKDFFPLLGLEENDRVPFGQMGMNSDGRYFSFTVVKTSPSRKTTSIFGITFAFERTANPRANEEALWKTLFEINDGTLYGKIPANDVGLVHIYDYGRGFYLTEDQRGNVAMDIELEKNPYFSADSLLQKGKTVGALMKERLQSLEKAGKGGPAYFNVAAWGLQSEVKPDPDWKHWMKFHF
ncbi:MAG: hypothetical protein A2942_02325 [Candidatus Lloydbacteria bacterium RIFCSPLOWO2_01_FULL_50_20]|uniref:Uncharacterized protein n=1 Tax=Candidatus Lloydbacteria bacterium RIFCSPLOWO2_01_FULL_50_20 TaxID=1798665 RepID=A0A1G2DFP4_9BACT|nr:MAG: hypothetical protein A3C13_03110 [Candidatus Lloydbacteria bacterium RIFCSPHIGHO2_02_FULL_50_11]OGZ12429.1 MAG: hypothetical protein A2942_02325 [Candidatus Lloydbacteria bacterium RIFCSPLOWO2_01_FULL_50_20]